LAPKAVTPWPNLDHSNAGTIMLIEVNQLDSLLAMALS
jgi:hypothetical protein